MSLTVAITISPSSGRCTSRLSGWGDAGGDGEDRFYIAVLNAYVYFKVRNVAMECLMAESASRIFISALRKRQDAKGCRNHEYCMPFHKFELSIASIIA
jgi:hypothetical protein